MADVVLIDLSSIAHPIWHMSATEPDPNFTSTKIVARVRALATGHPQVAICCDSGRSFRHDLSAAYKANRPEREAPLYHQIDLAREQLIRDGFPVWAVQGFEADDLIASATARALETPDLDVLVVTGDKDLLQLVGPRVKVMSARDGAILDAAGVTAKFGVTPEQMRDYLTLVGDASDNVKGARGIGPKRAAELLATHGTLDALYRVVDIGPVSARLTPSLVTALKEFRPHLEETRALIALRSDVDVPFLELANERVPQEVATFIVEDEDMEADSEPHTFADLDQPSNSSASTSAQTPPAAAPTGITIREPDILPAPADWERGLDPRTMKDARILAKDMYESRMFSAYGSPQAVLATVMVGRELGLPAMASLRSVHNIEGRHALSASLMVALVLKSGLAEFFDPVEFDERHAIFETKRKGARKLITLEHTIDMAVTAGLVKKDSNWMKVPTDMLVARAQSRLARMVYPDLLAGLYTPEELREARELPQPAVA